MFCVADCTDRFLKTYNKIEKSGLLIECKSIKLFLKANTIDNLKEAHDTLKSYNLSKVEFHAFPVEQSGNESSGEQLTLDCVLKHSLLFNNDKILYLHSKGVTQKCFSNDEILYLHGIGVTQDCRPIREKNVQLWIDYMEYFAIESYIQCLDKLVDFDAVGVKYVSTPYGHFSGNFWWANCNYIKSLNSVKESYRLSVEVDKNKFDLRVFCELWLMYRNVCRFNSLNQNDINFYHLQNIDTNFYKKAKKEFL